MAAPVWVLSVDLQTKTATFQTGLADAARSARGAFNDIKGGAGEMGGAVSYSTMEARHSVMMLGEEFGVHLPRSLTSFISSLGPLGPALEAAFPFLAIILGATLLLEHLSKLHEAGEKLTADQEKFEIAANSAFNSMDEKIIQAEKHADELKGDHLGALKYELELIDKQSMDQLVTEFDKVAKAADAVFGDMQSHWYSMGIGSAGAKNALDQFHNQYQLLMSEGKAEEANGLLSGTLKQAQLGLDMMRQFKDNQADNAAGKQGDYGKAAEAADVLRKMGLASKLSGTFTKEEADSQQKLVDALKATVTLQEKSAHLTTLTKGNATTEANKKDGKDGEAYRKALAEAQQKAANEEGRIIRDANRGIEEDIAQGWRERINETRQGSAERLAVMDVALKDEREQGMESTANYRELMANRVTLIRQMTEEAARLQTEAGREEANNAAVMGMLRVAAEKQAMELADAGRRVSDARRVAEESQIANEIYEIKHNELQAEIAALDQTGADYLNKLKALQDKERQLYQQHENELTGIKTKAEEDRNRRVEGAESQFQDTIARGLSQSIMGHQTWAKMLISLGDQVVSGMIENAIKSMLADDMTKERDAAAAARDGFKAGMKFPWPTNLAMAPILGAAAFTAVMAFAGGTDSVPGTGHGDSVPSMLTPGEGVVPGGVMDGLRNVARSGGFQQGQAIHLGGVHFAPKIHAIDATGVDRMLDKHAGKFQQHFETVLRKMNK